MNSQSPYPKAPRRTWTRTFLTLLAAFVLGGLILPYLHIKVSWREPVSEAAPGSGLGVTVGPPQPLSEAEAYARAAQIASPAVVNIDTKKRVRVPTSIFDDDWPSPRYGVASSEGSGVIINSQGDILTNEHVVGAAGEANKRISVTLQDGRQFVGTVIGSDHTTDVALVHIEGKNLPVAKLGTVRGLVPGQMVVAIGNPFGFRFTVTHGVISALDRPISTEDRVYERLIQTDCAINPGNSGGALVNLRGEVVGINTIVLNRGQGIGFAIPMDTAVRVANELKRYGKVKRPWLGVFTVTNSPALARFYGLPEKEGAVVANLSPDGPAYAAGIRPGDIITSINGKPVRTDDDLKEAEKKLEIGQRAKLEIQRGDQLGNGVVTVGEAP
ncbi:MAG TPA: trypsin-like peptidase domain-containing protein [Chthonomonadaceae bacterium]|jgi:S1-C subfamily serine protease|nr:trypsin-like peptidase domain-containing protein [Chthonomonadaceae bacterium]